MQTVSYFQKLQKPKREILQALQRKFPHISDVKFDGDPRSKGQKKITYTCPEVPAKTVLETILGTAGSAEFKSVSLQPVSVTLPINYKEMQMSDKQQAAPAPATRSLEQTLAASLFPEMEGQFVQMVSRLLNEQLKPAMDPIKPALQNITNTINEVTRKVEDSTDINNLRVAIEENNKATQVNLTALIERKANDIIVGMGAKCDALTTKCNAMTAEIAAIKQENASLKGEIRKMLSGLTFKVDKVGG